METNFSLTLVAVFYKFLYLIFFIYNNILSCYYTLLLLILMQECEHIPDQKYTQ